MKTDPQEIMKKVHNILKRMWMHDHDGSELFPVPAKYWDSVNHFNWAQIIEERKKLKEKFKVNVNEHLFYDIMFNEVLPLLEEAIGE